MTDAAQLLAAFGLFERISTGAPKLDDRVLDDLAHRRRAFEHVHLGSTSTTIARAEDAIRSADELLPPRSGHLGNWDDVARGRSGTIDYNKAICAERGLGYPLVYGFNLTEDEALDDGDWIYVPGSIASGRERIVLSLHTWDGVRFVRRSRRGALFVPFVLADVDGELVPLAKLHWARMQRLPGLTFELEANVVLRRRELVRAILTTLVDHARRAPDPVRALGDVLGRVATLDGVIHRGAPVPDGSGFRLDDTRYDGVDALVDAAFVAYEAVAAPSDFVAHVRDFPRAVPVVSNTLAGVLSAVLDTHFPGDPPPAALTTPCNPHVHWGALGMAGYPLKKKGYFTQRSNRRKTRALCKVLVRELDVAPVFYVLLPASIYTLCPSSAYPDDAVHVAELLRRVRDVTRGLDQAPDLMQTAIDAAAAGWAADVGPRVSRYFVHRFARRRSVLAGAEVPDGGDSVEPDGFGALTLRHACMTVGALTEAFAGR